MKSLLSLFPNASQSTLERNPTLTQQPLADRHGVGQKSATVRRGSMNKTEEEFAFRLQQDVNQGAILRYVYEGITLRFAGVKYTPDFVVFRDVNMTPDADNWLVFIEVKGPFTEGKFERAVERFRHARTYWTEFAFELHQKTKEGWKRIE